MGNQLNKRLDLVEVVRGRCSGEEVILINSWTTCLFVGKDAVPRMDRCGTLILTSKELKFVPNVKGKDVTRVTLDSITEITLDPMRDLECENYPPMHSKNPFRSSDEEFEAYYLRSNYYKQKRKEIREGQSRSGSAASLRDGLSPSPRKASLSATRKESTPNKLNSAASVRKADF